MRKATIILALLLALFGLTAAPAQAVVSVPTATTTAQVELQYKMGALPAQSKICIANGVGADYPLEYLLERWNDFSYSALRLVVQNRCSTYSITNRMTVYAYTDNTTTCGIITQRGNYWDSTQGKYIYNQNPLIYVNQNAYCASNDTEQAHRFAMYVGVILGLGYETATYKVMGTNATALNNVKYPTGYDVRDAAGVYGLTAKK